MAMLDVMEGLPSESILLAIVGFGVGVEAGRQVVLLPLFEFLTAARHLQRDLAERDRLSMELRQIRSAVILLVGIYYLCITLAGKR